MKLNSVLGVVAGIVVGSAVNMGLIKIGPSIIPLPDGADTTTMEGLAAAMERFELRHFVTPFLAHALGTLVGAFTAAKIAKGRGTGPAVIVGVFFLIGGISAAAMLGAPMWFNAVDLAVAYIPMAYVGAALAGGAPAPAE